MTFRLPTWVREADGRTVPFDADRISGRLFAATARLGSPNSFLARELADGVLHFLSHEDLGETTTWQIVDDLVAKVVRELGQPELAHAYGQDEPAEEIQAIGARDTGVLVSLDPPFPDAMRTARAAYALGAVFGPDLRSACEEELIALGGLQAPDRLAAQAISEIRWNEDSPWETGWRTVRDAAIGIGGRLILEGTESSLGSLNEHDLTCFLQGLREGLKSSETACTVNLHQAAPTAPSAADSLFAPASELALDASAFYRRFFECWRRASFAAFGSLHWHLQEANLAEIPSSFGKRDDADDLVFVFDRPRRGVSLAAGLARPSPAILLEAGLRLDRFAAMAGVDRDPTLLLDKLGSLVRMAVSAAVRKRAYLRKACGSLQRGFMLDRATLHLTPLGLDGAVQSVLGESLVRSALSLDLACRMADRLREIAAAESRKANLEIVLDSPHELQEPTCAQVETPLRMRIESWGQVHRRLGHGTAIVASSPEISMADLIVWTWRKSDVGRLAFRPLAANQAELIGAD
ncbi:MAG: hypothetical protein K2X38_22550 [Gemmataceae bacterium]|nr:hypothetical protein [Gemmataceae bacterium]